MDVLSHEHLIIPVEGRLLSKDELETRGLVGYYYVSGRCTIVGCDFIEVTHLAPPEPPRSRLGRRSKNVVK